MKSLDKAQEEAFPGWLNHFVWAPVNPLFTDALKTIAYELASEGTPDCVFVPTAGGDLLYGIHAGFLELKAMKLIEKVPRVVVPKEKGPGPL